MSDDRIPSGLDGKDGPEGHPNQRFCECGEAWFEGALVAIEKDGKVNGLSGWLRCIGCGTPLALDGGGS